MYGHRLSHELEGWFLQHAGTADDPQWVSFLGRFRSGLDVKLAELMADHDNGGRFGMSKAGGCTRATVLKYLGEEGEPFTGSTQWTFLLGHLIEILVVSAMQEVGYEVYGAQEPVRLDPFMHSYSDGILMLDGRETNLSVKSAGYKKSGKKFGRKGDKPSDYERRGFPELPFEGVRKSQPGWYAQAHAEMLGYQRAGRDIEQTLVVVASKDIIKAMEGDPYLGPDGNGSLSFYAELIPFNADFAERVLEPVWAEAWQDAQAGRPGRALFLNNELPEYRELMPASEEWRPNADRTGTFNPCSYCDLVSACKSHIASEWRNRRAAAGVR